jgi:hypothetical protein
MNDTDMSVQLRRGFREMAEGRLYHGNSVLFLSIFWDSFEASVILMCHVLNILIGDKLQPKICRDVFQ